VSVFFCQMSKTKARLGAFQKGANKLMVLSKVEGHMYGAIEDKGMVPFGLEQFGLELTAERLRAERLCTILKRPITVNV